ncbi:hypothetical protein DLAC_10063 [Tieghemostelium lacteum]|uniref:Uncharacterized protein n=1 Tax=Tieghemostelium lacteum TaxID=361077 RepID=A0A151Z614_TIELA|nr:hypothetical protein DLAC_10063 [Tieghemostelium lacteum]|eukprot:KYQ89402.1 hypothetical protein DLAC_10063 [Tieghemostelium lacteum]
MFPNYLYKSILEYLILYNIQHNPKGYDNLLCIIRLVNHTWKDKILPTIDISSSFHLDETVASKSIKLGIKCNIDLNLLSKEYDKDVHDKLLDCVTTLHYNLQHNSPIRILQFKNLKKLSIKTDTHSIPKLNEYKYATIFHTLEYLSIAYRSSNYHDFQFDISKTLDKFLTNTPKSNLKTLKVHSDRSSFVGGIESFSKIKSIINIEMQNIRIYFDSLCELLITSNIQSLNLNKVNCIDRKNEISIQNGTVPFFELISQNKTIKSLSLIDSITKYDYTLTSTLLVNLLNENKVLEEFKFTGFSCALKDNPPLFNNTLKILDLEKNSFTDIHGFSIHEMWCDKSGLTKLILPTLDHDNIFQSIKTFHLSNLTKLTLTEYFRYDNNLCEIILANPPSLKILKVEHHNTNAFLEALKSNTNLTSLSIHNQSGKQLKRFLKLNHPTITKYKVEFTDVSVLDIAPVLGKCQYLTNLKLSNSGTYMKPYCTPISYLKSIETILNTNSLINILKLPPPYYPPEEQLLDSDIHKKLFNDLIKKNYVNLYYLNITTNPEPLITEILSSYSIRSN